MIIVGTAGHIDHGKSAIVKRLTGTDPDRLPEEKARGMTIDLGFAFYATPNNEQIALVDVPGHERFVKNMIAGAGGIDAVILVIAADDGWMPQSEEHFQIIRLLGVKHGLVVINKIDLVELDWLELLEQDVRDKIAGSFLEGAPIIKLSAETGVGIDALKAHLDTMPAAIESKKDIGKARLAVDRSFIRPGIGGVVTGTLRGGSLSVGQMVGVWPGMVSAKIRTLQSNGRDVEVAVPGQRTAVSLTGIDRELLVRGGVITDRIKLDYFAQRPVLALSMEMLKTAPVGLEDRRRALMIVGTSEIEGEVRLYDRKEFKPGERGLVFFRPDNPAYALVGDHYILRLPTPMVTLGGGRLLDHLELFPRRKQLAKLTYLQVRTRLDLESLVRSELQKLTFARRDALLLNADLGAEQIDNAVKQMIKAKTVGVLNDYLFDVESIGKVAESAVKRISDELDKKSHLKGLNLDQVKQVLPGYDSCALILLEYLVSQQQLVANGELYDLSGRGMSLKGVIKQAYEEIMAQLADHRFDPPPLSQLAGGGKIHQQAIKYILDSGEGYKCGSSFLFLTDAWDEIVDFVRVQINQQERLAVADLRDKFGFSRKFAIPILEELDRLGLTQREGDFRIKGKKFEN
jgi:selenocysteine-specific elongation factor